MKIPKVETIQKNLKLANKTLFKKHVDAAKAHFVEQMVTAARHGMTALHTTEFRYLDGMSPGVAKSFENELKDAGYKVSVTENGHQVEWPAEELEPDTPEDPKEKEFKPHPDPEPTPAS